MTADHARGPVKGVSSYDKICVQLRQTKDFADYLNHAAKSLESVTLAGWTFEAGGYDHPNNPRDAKNIPPPNWSLLIDWGLTVDGKPNIEKFHGPTEGIWNLSIGYVCREPGLNSIVHKHFGQPSCKTYFCKKHTLLGLTKDGSSDSRGSNKWIPYAHNVISDALGREIEKAQDSVREQIQSAISSQEFIDARTQFHERGIIEEIKKVLLKFSGVAKPHVYRTAVEEYVCTEIMES